jgi:hypothetical protein
MTRRERLIATLRGEPVDRPAVSFYEINGLDQDPADRDPFNIYAHPSWRPLIDLARDRTDRIVMRGVAFAPITLDPIDAVSETVSVVRNGSRFTTRRLRTPGRILTARTRRDPDVNTVWTEEHLLKDAADLDAFLALPPAAFEEKVKRAIAEGTAGDGRGFVLMPSACPYGKRLSPTALKNYETMVDVIERP